MGTQAVVSIVSHGQTIVKAVAGCSGAFAPDLAEALRAQPGINTAQEVYDLATKIGFGCISCLVVLDRENIVSVDGDDIEADYRATFDNPEWNPRWDRGTAAYVEIVQR